MESTKNIKKPLIFYDTKEKSLLTLRCLTSAQNPQMNFHSE